MDASLSKITVRRLAWAFWINLMGCMVSKAALPSNWKKIRKGIYAEDLSIYRIEFCKSPQIVANVPPMLFVCPLDQTQHLEERLAQRKAAYERLPSLKGYTIQLYMGSSRTEALKAQDLASTFAYPAKLHYRQPHYTVQLGFFSDRLEAYFLYLTLVKKMPGAMIRPCLRTR